MKSVLIPGLALLILTSMGVAIKPGGVRENSRVMSTVNLTPRSKSPQVDTVTIPDDTVPKVTIPPGTIQVLTDDIKPQKSGIKTCQRTTFNQQDVVNRQDAKLMWEGLFEKKGRVYLQRTRIKIKRVHSEVDQEPSDKTGWDVQCKNRDDNIILIYGAKGLVDGMLKTALHATEIYYAGQVIRFKYYGIMYTLYTTGIKRDGRIYNYKLFLMAKVKGHYMNQQLRSLSDDEALGNWGEMSQDEQIEFAGDLDGDHIPDFIIEGSGFPYSFSSLYLSKPAGNKAIVKFVSSFGDSD